MVLLLVIGPKAFDFVEKQLRGTDLRTQPFSSLRDLLIHLGASALSEQEENPLRNSARYSIDERTLFVFTIVLLIIFVIVNWWLFANSKPEPTFSDKVVNTGFKIGRKYFGL